MNRIALFFLAASALDAFGASADCADRIGVMTHFAHGWALDVLPALAATGTRHVRDEIYWDDVEVAPGRFEFPKKYEDYLSALRERGIRPLVPLTFENRHHDDGLTPYTEAGFAAYARYATEVVRRHGEQLEAVEIWNEYNGGFAKGPATADRAATYAKMLRHAYRAIKRERPGLVVLGASTAGLPLPYLERLADAGAFEHMDAISIHPYRGSLPPETLEPAIRDLQALLARRRPAAPLPIWVTEIGWTARPPGTFAGPEFVDEDTQADYLVRALTLLLSLDVEKVYWYQLREHGVDKGLGLLRAAPGYEPKPAYRAFTTLLARLRGVKTVVRETAPDGVYCLRLDSATDSAVPPARLLWSVTSRALPLPGATRLVRIDGAAEPAPDWIVLTGSPVYIEGLSGPPLIDEHPRPILADSAAGFSLSQGENGWSYGTLALAGGEPAVFTPAVDARVTDWKAEWILPGSPWSISAEEQHPAVVAGLPVAAARRWTSARGGPVRVVARFDAGGQGDGVRVRVLAEGRVRATALIGGPRRPSAELGFDCVLPRGGSLDFAVDPGPAGSPDHDATRVAVSISPASTHE